MQCILQHLLMANSYNFIKDTRQESAIVIPAAMRKKHGLKTGSEFSVVDYAGILTLVPVFKDPVRQGAGMLKGNDSLTGVIVEEHHQEHD